mmetsp:Transcript_14308/g.39500  ORF Transcript_14308/g.39500 Transcript_14308/m.39500 type:complete len:230 (+) Transcript_14308:293-982(+)
MAETSSFATKPLSGCNKRAKRRNSRCCSSLVPPPRISCGVLAATIRATSAAAWALRLSTSTSFGVGAASAISKVRATPGPASESNRCNSGANVSDAVAYLDPLNEAAVSMVLCRPFAAPPSKLLRPEAPSSAAPDDVAAGHVSRCFTKQGWQNTLRSLSHPRFRVKVLHDVHLVGRNLKPKSNRGSTPSSASMGAEATAFFPRPRLRLLLRLQLRALSCDETSCWRFVS